MAHSVVSNFGSGHDLTVCELEPRVGLCADSLEPGACFGFRVCLSVSLSAPLTLRLNLSKINKTLKKLKKKKIQPIKPRTMDSQFMLPTEG